METNSIKPAAEAGTGGGARTKNLAGKTAPPRVTRRQSPK